MTMTSEKLALAVAGWRPCPKTTRDLLGPSPVAALAAVLDLDGRLPSAGDPLPPLWHWLYFLEWPAHGELSEDGHPTHGRFLPPITDRRRMYAGGRLEIHAPLVLGVPAERTSALANTAVKQGRSGAMLFVTLRHEIRQCGKLKLVDEHDLVYRSGDPSHGPSRGAPARAKAAANEDAAETHDTATGPSPASGSTWRRGFIADTVRLARFSALTANAHRIHYDHPYTTTVEHYPGLVVHGPLLALLMAELVRHHRPGDAVRSFTYRFHRPVFAGDPCSVLGHPDTADGAALAVLGDGSRPHATGEVMFG